MPTVTTEALELAYTETGDPDGTPVLLLHGWPDAARGWAPVAARLGEAGHRVLLPEWRGTGGTRFRDPGAVRDATAVALASDALDLADALGLDRFAVVGHDWGARVAYVLAAVVPERLSSVAALALAYQPRGEVPRHPDWVATTLNGYRSRFLPDEPVDPRHAGLRARVAAVERLTVPTLMVQGGADACDPPSESEGLEGFFDDYRRVVLDGVGHFPQREAPGPVADLLLAHLAAHP